VPLKVRLMSEVAPEFGKLMKRVGAGSEGAARELVDKYGPHILRVVRRRLGRNLRSKFDSVDFVQAVWASFFADRAELNRFDEPDKVAAYLRHLASNKVIDEYRRRVRTGKRDVSRERPLESSSAARPAHALTAGPTPSEVAVGNELYQEILGNSDQDAQRVAALRHAGISQESIAKELGVSTKTVQRVLQKLRLKSQK
jgi:RNA polymerase sigma-70 factor (ECF subfamily)